MMKKGRGKKRKVSSHTNSHNTSHRRLNKPADSFLRKSLPILIAIAILLLIAIVLNLVSTGNAITGNAVINHLNTLIPCGAGEYSAYPADCGGTCATTQAECSASSTDKNQQAVNIVAGSWAETWPFLKGTNGWLVIALTYIFGNPITDTATINAISAGIITIAVWILLFVTFSDIIASFSTFHKGVSWIIGFIIALIGANLGFVVKMTAWFIGLFAFLGSLAVLVGLGAAFVSFLAANIGIAKLGTFLLKQKALKTGEEAKAAGIELAGGLEGLGTAIKGLRKSMKGE
jgi:hypothetical protein